VLVIPPVSEQGAAWPRVETIDSRPRLGKKAWFAVYTAPRHEKFVQAQLLAKQIQTFLPLYTAVRRWKNGVRREVQHPILPGYVFVCLGAEERLPVVQTSGVVYIVGNGSSPLPLEDHEMHTLRVGAQRGSLIPHPYLCAGARVCITRGPFQGITGYVEHYGGELTFVVTIRLIERSFAIRVQADDLELAG
jgi:transcription termination/antitermination protein NusG